MKRKVYVSVEFETDSLGIETPLKIRWNDNTQYVIERVIHASRESASLLKYVVLVQGRRKIYLKKKIDGMLNRFLKVKNGVYWYH